MSKKPPPKIEEAERRAQEVMNSLEVNTEKKISFPGFISFVTKSKNILQLLSDFSLITKDDLRPNFGQHPEGDLPDCDSDLEQEVMYKGVKNKFADEVLDEFFAVTPLYNLT